MSQETKIKIDGLQARIKSAYYLKDTKTDQKLRFLNADQAYIYLKQYINSIKDQSDIIIFNDETKEVIINTINKELPLDRYVFINPANVDINDLTSNIDRYK